MARTSNNNKLLFPDSANRFHEPHEPVYSTPGRTLDIKSGERVRFRVDSLRALAVNKVWIALSNDEEKSKRMRQRDRETERQAERTSEGEKHS